MIIKMKQNIAIGNKNPGITVSIGPISFNTHHNDGPSSEYDFSIDGTVIGKFYLYLIKQTPQIKKGCITASFVSTTAYNINTTEVECPEGFKTSEILGLKIASYKDLDDKRQLLFQNIQYNFFNTGKQVGLFRGYIIQRKKGIFCDLYNYDTINWKGLAYYMYPLKIDNIFYYCYYQNNTLIAIMQKDSGDTFNDQYTIYALDNIDKDLLCQTAAMFDYLYFENTNESGANGRTIDRSPLDPGLLKKNGPSEFNDKFDPTFILKIKATK
jgi:hypothetical protein